MSTVRRAIHIDRPRKEVFQYINRPENDPEWQPEVKQRQVEGRIEQGAELTIRREVLGREIETKAKVVEFDPPRISTSRSVAGPLQFEGGFHLHKADRGTEIVFEADVKPTGAYEMGSETFAEEFGDEIEASLKKLKEALES